MYITYLMAMAMAMAVCCFVRRRERGEGGRGKGEGGFAGTYFKINILFLCFFKKY